ncbi:hypothetical protein WH47_04585 [Habropoda laboriosa]|uniref:Uncharacterized protein n=1 Tax=Habropoda laboriosa TaxID=597456 RepID=A0A0L7R290_9HYME|nr:hypothetical protein WH47_04585 [Habropoda laboriosa]
MQFQIAAHGKRSGGHNNAYSVPSKTINDLQQDTPSLTKEQLMLSRLIGRPLVSNKHRDRWDRLFKVKTNFPENWNDGERTAHFISDESIRDRMNTEEMDEGKSKHTNGVQDVTGSVNDERNEIPEILLIPTNENNEHGSKPQNIEFFKFLVN